MSFIGSMFGGSSGSGFQANGAPAPIINATTASQANQGYNASQGALGTQAGLVAALGAANGIGNQSQVFNQLQGIAAGTGPNPAAATLNNATGTNVANTAALMAGQRGASANAGLLARTAGQTGAATQQTAVGQGAANQANQSLNAINTAAGVAGQQVGQQIAGTQGLVAGTQGEQGQILGSIAGQNNANVGLQGNINSTNAGIAGVNAQGQQGILGGLAGGVGSALGLAKGGVVPKPIKAANGVYVDASNSPPIPTAPVAMAPMAPTPTVAAPAMPSMGPRSAAGQHLSSFSNMGMPAGQPKMNPMQTVGNTVGSAIGNLFKSNGTPPPPSNPGATANPTATTEDWAAFAGAPGTSKEDQDASMNQTGGSNNYARGGKVPALVSPGEKVITKDKVNQVVAGRMSPMQAGKTVPGKPKVGGTRDTEANDVVPRKLDEGSIVLPRSVTQAKNPHWAAHAFVSAIMAKKGLPTRGPKKPKV